MIKTDAVHRLIDANFNRAKEGLRVCEDVCRFVLNDGKLSGAYKTLRHQLSGALSLLGIKLMINARDIEGDVGKKTFSSELKRKNIQDIFYANSQRAKESLRVLEEFAKLKRSRSAQDLKKIRYSIYAIERKVVQKF
ncbi:MAG: thiamine-phosphate pyrophosphorylase [Candidatus Omnitrophota bacterium]